MIKIQQMSYHFKTIVKAIKKIRNFFNILNIRKILSKGSEIRIGDPKFFIQNIQFEDQTLPPHPLSSSQLEKL